ncbi:MAG: NAD-dependent epimerase/dehydratase family protein [Proteobacteria bacterium]|nr:MAG: NAD-dependent epimerase/dehydratase family protein [Pseudomonadota bacterium]
MKALITGAAGFVGSHLVDSCLAQGHSVRVIVRKSSDLTYLKTLEDRIEIVYGDLTDCESVLKAAAGMDVIFHPAGRVTDWGSREDFYQANCVATEHLLEAAKAAKVPRFVFVSSPSIFADNEDHIDFDETKPYPKHYANYYAETKAISEREVLAANSPTLVTCSLRPRGIWGPRDKSGFLPKLMSSIAKGKLKNLAPGKKVMTSICHVQNIADACLLAAASPNVGGKAYFIADDEQLVLWDFLDEVARTFGLKPIEGSVNPVILNFLVGMIELIWKIPALKNKKSPPISRYSASLLTKHGTYSIARATKDFGYRPRVSPHQGLKDLKKDIDAHGGLDEFLKHVS